MNCRNFQHKYRYGQWALSILVFFCLTSLSCAMGTRGGSPSPTDSKEESASQKVTIVDILSKTETYDAKVVTVDGAFKGWKGKCASSYSVTRSDWILADGTDCIYVSGTLPSGVSAASPKDERIEVTGMVKVKANGKVNLKAMNVKVTK